MTPHKFYNVTGEGAGGEETPDYRFKEGELTFLLADFKKMDIAPEGFFPTFKEGYRLAMSRCANQPSPVLRWLKADLSQGWKDNPKRQIIVKISGMNVKYDITTPATIIYLLQQGREIYFLQEEKSNKNESQPAGPKEWVKEKYNEWLKMTGLDKDSQPALAALNCVAFLMYDATPLPLDKPVEPVKEEGEIPKEIRDWIDVEADEHLFFEGADRLFELGATAMYRRMINHELADLESYKLTIDMQQAALAAEKEANASLRKQIEGDIIACGNIVDQNCWLLDERDRTAEVDRKSDALWLKRVGELEAELASLREYGRASSQEHEEIQRELRARITDLISEVVSNSEEAEAYRDALIDLNAALDDIWNTRGISKEVPEWVIKRICSAQQKSAITLTNNKDHD